MEKSSRSLFTVIVICTTILLLTNMCTKRKYDKIKGIHQIELNIKVPNEKEKTTYFDIELLEDS